MEELLGAGLGIISIVVIVLGVFFIVISILLPFNVFRIKEILIEINDNLIKNNKMAVHNNKRLQEIEKILSKDSLSVNEAGKVEDQ